MSHGISTYTTPARLKLAADAEFLRQISDDDSDGLSDPEILQWGADSANSMMDGYLALNPGIPIEDITPALRYLADKIAIFMIADRPPREASENVKLAYDAAMEQLKAIVAGDFTIGEDSSESSSASNVLMANRTEDDATFTQDWLDRNFPRKGHGTHGR